jgi:tetratricopeptide (TPR) repeat protein
MDTDLFLQQLRDPPLDEGRAYIQEHIEELSDHKATGELLEEEALRVLYTPFLSLKLAELLIFFGEYVEHLPSHALGLKAKGDALMMIEHHQAALECLDSAGQEFLFLEDEENWARSRISWTISTAWLGRVEQALQEADRARNVFLRLDEGYWVCVIDHNIAMIYDHVGRYQDAIRLYENMLAIYPTFKNQDEIFMKRSIALAEMNQAIHLAMLGSFERAYHFLQQAQDSFRALGEKDLVIYAEIDLVNLDYMQGYYGSALRRYYQAHDSFIQSDIDEPLLFAELKLSIANCLVKLNRVQDACHLADDAVKIYRQSGISLSTGNALREYATILVACGKLKDALGVLDEAWILFNHGRFDHHTAATRLQQAGLLLKTGSASTAYDQAKIAREYFESRGLVARSLQASLIMVDALIDPIRDLEIHERKETAAKNLQEAISLGKEVAAKARRYSLQEEVYKTYYLLGQIFILLKDPIKAARYYKAAIIQIEHILDDLVYDLSPSFLQSTWIVYEDMIALCLQQSRVEQAFSYLEQARSMALHQHLNKSKVTLGGVVEQKDMTLTSTLAQNNAAILRIQYEFRKAQEDYHNYNVLLANFDPSVSSSVDREVIQQELKRREEKISELSERLYLYQSDTHSFSRGKRSRTHKIRQVDFEQLRGYLSPDQVLLAYFLYKGRILIFAATTESLTTHELLDGVEQLERLLPLLHARLDPRGWFNGQPHPQHTIRLLNKLYDLLIKPVAELLPSSGRLTVVPYGPLHKLPFHALHDGSRFLVENVQINYLPASNVLMHLGTPDSAQYSPSDNTRVSSRLPLVFGYSGDKHLQRVRDEAESIATMLKGNCYLESKATISRLIEQAPGSPIIHLATHGESRLDAPNFSYVRLADGHLNAIDAFNLDLRACELVTLSGCETGLALSGGGDEQLGLGRAFLAAGATSLVMSLWTVEDNATNELMQIFYQNLLRGENKAQALRAAQCSLLHRTDLAYTHPYFWAAFRLVGDIAPLKPQAVKQESFTCATNL